MTFHNMLDSYTERTRDWLKDVMQELAWDSENRAMYALRAVLQAVRDWSAFDDAVEFGGHLPVVIRGLYYEGWKPYRKATPIHRTEEFLATVRHYFPGDPGTEIENVARAVFSVLERRTVDGEIEDVRHLLPGEIDALWPETVTSSATMRSLPPL